MNDRIVICKKCGSDVCYRQEINEEIINYSCLGCGFITSTLHKRNSELFEQQWETLPELFKDLSFEDSDGCVWIPNTINIPKKGMVFVNGTSINNWGWSVANYIPVKEEEKEQPDGSYLEFKLDVDNIKHFTNLQYFEALDHLGLLDVEI